MQLAPYIRETPLFCVENNSSARSKFYLKLENLQVTGAFKIRGALNAVLQRNNSQIKQFVAASAGNHGAGIAYAARLVNKSACIVLPEKTATSKVERLKKLGATVLIAGSDWNKSNSIALALAEGADTCYVHPFAHEDVISGQGTIAREMLAAEPDLDCIIAACGGGGLIAGLGIYAKAINPAIRIICAEPTGARTLHAAVQAGRAVALPQLATRANSLSVAETSPLNYELARSYVDDFVAVTDEDATKAAAMLWEDFGLAVELSAAVAFAAALKMDYGKNKLKRIGIVICAAGQDGLNNLKETDEH